MPGTWDRPRLELHPHERQFFVDGVVAPLGDRAFDILDALARRPGQLVTKDELLDLWLPSIVSEGNLYVHVHALRAVGVQIASVPGRGYRLLSEISLAAARAEHPQAPVGGHADLGLPATLPVLVGREADIDAVTDLMREQRLVTLVGAGGVGKTLLAQHLLKLAAGRYPDGAHWIDLSGVHDAGALVAALSAAVFGSRRDAETAEKLIATLSGRRVLLVLDNAEQVVSHVARWAARLLASTGTVSLLVTSQAPLNIAAERVHRLAGLRWPEDAVAPQEAVSFAAVRMLMDRVRAGDARIELAEQDVPHAAHICKSLDGLPLAMELAAPLVRSRGFKRVAEAMQDRLRLLQARRAEDVPARQQSLQAAIGWSHDLLQPHEQCLFRRLGVLQGASTLGLVLRVSAATGEPSDLSEEQALQALDALVDRSLVLVTTLPFEQEPRFRPLESTRTYALELLARSGELAAVRRCHAQELARAFDETWQRPEAGLVSMDAWRKATAPDLENARGAFAWATAAGEAELALRIGVVLLRALPRSHHSERHAVAGDCQMLMNDALPVPLRLSAQLQLSGVWRHAQPALGLAAARQAMMLAGQATATMKSTWPQYQALSAFVQAACELREQRQLAEAMSAVSAMHDLEDPAWPPQRLVWGAEADAALCALRGDLAGRVTAARRAWELTCVAGNIGRAQFERLLDAELRAGDLAGVVQSGMKFVEQPSVAARHDYTATHARLSVIAALLAMDDHATARQQALKGWPQACRFGLQSRWTGQLALLAALEGRHRAAAMLLGHARSHQATVGAPEALEAAALARCDALVVAALGAKEVDLLRSTGAGLGDDEVGRLAFDAAAA